MTDFHLAAIVLVATSGFAYVNARVFKFPSSVGLMATALAASIVLLALERMGALDLSDRVRALVTQLDFGQHGIAPGFPETGLLESRRHGGWLLTDSTLLRIRPAGCCRSVRAADGG